MIDFLGIDILSQFYSRKRTKCEKKTSKKIPSITPKHDYSTNPHQSAAGSSQSSMPAINVHFGGGSPGFPLFNSQYDYSSSSAYALPPPLPLYPHSIRPSIEAENPRDFSLPILPSSPIRSTRSSAEI